MKRALSEELRRRIVEAVANGESSRAVAKRFQVSPPTVSKWTSVYRNTGSIAGKKRRREKNKVLTPHMEFIVSQIQLGPHLTVRDLKIILNNHGVNVAPTTLWRFLREEGFQLEKIKRKNCPGDAD